MKVIGLTGGIGSGKTLIANLFAFLGAAIYDSDQHAKDLMITDKSLINQIKSSFGEDVYKSDNSLDRDKLRTLVFNDPDKLNQLNSIVHAAVRKDFKEWIKVQQSKLLIFESALILTRNWLDLFDKIIYVSADEELRLSRVKERDKLDEDTIIKIMDNQLFDMTLISSPKIVVIDNSCKDLLIPKVIKLYNSFD